MEVEETLPTKTKSNADAWYKLRIRAVNLPKVNCGFLGTGRVLPNTYARVSYTNPDLCIGETEIIENSKSPQWITTMNMKYRKHARNVFSVQIFHRSNKNCDDDSYDSDDRKSHRTQRKGEPRKSTTHRGDHFYLGRGTFDIDDVLESRYCSKAKRLRNGGCVFVRLQLINLQDQNTRFRFQFRGIDLIGNHIKKSFIRQSLSSLSDSDYGGGVSGTSSEGLSTVVEISRRNCCLSQTWVKVYRSNRVRNSNKPRWDAGEMDLQSFCDGNLSQVLRIAVYVVKRGQSDVLLGICEATVNDILLKSSVQHGNTKFNHHDGNSGYGISVYSNNSDISSNAELSFCEIKDYYLQRHENCTELVGRLRVEFAQLVSLTSLSPTSLPPQEKQQLEHQQLLHGSPGCGNCDPLRVDLMKIQSQSQHDLINYIDHGCKLDLCVAIDFTSSNGNPRIPGTLHYQSDDVMNDYEETISVIGEALVKYSRWNEFRVWGFGAKFGGGVATTTNTIDNNNDTVKHIFQCSTTETVVGVDGILNAYKSIFQYGGITMSGPTVFHRVIQAAAVRARKQQELHSRAYVNILQQTADKTTAKNNQNSATIPPPYCILLIITDGIMDNFEETKRKLEVYSQVPLSIIFVGVGRTSDFRIMYDLCEQHQLQQWQQEQLSCCFRKNTTFVEFRKHQHDPTSLAKAALEHLPRQITEFMIQNGIH